MSIAAFLTKQRIPTPAGKEKWQSSTVKSILTNEKYKGDALLQKTFTVDFLSKKAKINEGEVPQYYVEKSHPVIVSAEVFDLAQYEMKRRAKKGRHTSAASLFSDKLVCGECGAVCGSKVWHGCLSYHDLALQREIRHKRARPICGMKRSRTLSYRQSIRYSSRKRKSCLPFRKH